MIACRVPIPRMIPTIEEDDSAAIKRRPVRCTIKGERVRFPLQVFSRC